jgi:Fe2+ or Zn2+ uptake regulation protein
MRAIRPIRRRATRQKQAIVEFLKKSKNHPSAAQVYTELRKAMPSISLGTIYRALGVLKEQGLIQELPYGGFSRYDGRTDLHYHITCLSCGRVSDVEAEVDGEALVHGARAPGFQVTGHRLEFYGYCSRCQPKGA